jgi:hypothetical protein
MGFELTLAVLVVVFCGFGVARSAGMETLRHHTRALQLLSEESGLRPDVQMSTADTWIMHATCPFATCQVVLTSPPPIPNLY